MSLRNSRGIWLGLAASCASLTAALPGHAQTPAPDIDCEALPEPRLFIEAGDTQMSMLAALARKLRDAEEPITLVYLPRSTCTLADNFFHDKATTEVMRYIPSIAEDADWDGTTPRQCNNKTGGFPIDLGIGATFISSCTDAVTSAQPENVQIFDGPVQAYGFVVPENSLAASGGGITWEEAYYVFSGQGVTANVAPWTATPSGATAEESSVFIRGATTSTLLTCAANVEPTLLPASSWVGFRNMGQADRSSVVVNGLSAKTGAARDSAIGILGIDVYEEFRSSLDLLAFQAKGQKFGFYPDSSPSRTDKRNVRDGHYVPWSYTQYITKVEDGVPLNPLVERILDIVRGDPEVRLKSAAGVSPAFDVDALEVLARKGLVPDCAMKVSRERDGSDLSLYTPEAPCGCFFESVVDPDLTSDDAWQERCEACEGDDDCTVGLCRHGFCEGE